MLPPPPPPTNTRLTLEASNRMTQTSCEDTLVSRPLSSTINNNINNVTIYRPAKFTTIVTCLLPFYYYFTLTLLILLLHIAFIQTVSSTVSQEPSEGKVTYVPGQSITLRCNSTEYKEFKWYRSKYVIANGTYNYGNFAESIVPSYSLSATDPKAFEPIIPNDDDVFEIRNERLRIPRANQSYIRDYKCQALRSDHDDSPKIEVTHEAAIFQVRAQPYIVDFDIATSHTRRSGIVTDGDRLEINCEVRSENQGPVNITWVKSRISDDESSYDEIPNDSSNDHIEIYNTNTFTRTLVIESVTLSDRSYYMCVANNNVTNVTTKTIFIRVKDKLIAFWPFVGIVSELAILFSVIFIYEHQRAATDRE